MTPTERQQQERTDAAFGEWVRERLAAQKPDRWTQQRLRDELALRGHEVKREWVNQVINGKRASSDLRMAVEGILGPFPEPTTGATETPADLVAAITAQTAAINALVALLAGDLPARVAALEPVVSRLAERVLEEDPAPAAPLGRAG